MLRTGFLALLGLGLVLGLGAQNVAEDVLKSADLAGVKFIDYVGPVAVIESRAAIIGIGQDLGSRRKADPTGALRGTKYSALRLVDPASTKLGADVLILGEQAGVDTIRNLNWIVAGYLEKAFGYSFDNALLLADFVTRYNAVYRGKLDYFQQNYVPGLAAVLTPQNAGLALSYKDWPGKTRIVIPLRNTLSKGPAGLVNAEEVSNPAVTSSMKQNQASLDEQKKLADLKEKEIILESKVIQEKQKILDAQKKALQAAAQAPAAAASPSPAPAGPPPATPPQVVSPSAASPAASSVGTPPPGKAVTPPPPSLVSIAAEQKVLDAAKAANAARDRLLQQERQTIQKEDQKLQTSPSQPAAPPAGPPPATVPFLETLDANGLGRLDLIDTSAHKLWKASDVNSIRRGVFQPFGAGYLVTAGENRGNAAVRLMILSSSDLSPLATSKQDVSPEASFLVVGTQVYAVVKDTQGRWVVGLYDAELQSIQLSGEAVKENTGLAVTPQVLIVQGSNGNLIFLDPQTLKKIAGGHS
ncbi:MAG: hypothetical protein HKM06_09780 [Spirochaetales bacterium]|nr:hypothetical protein [Spirochaetales bacterium]